MNNRVKINLLIQEYDHLKTKNQLLEEVIKQGCNLYVHRNRNLNNINSSFIVIDKSYVLTGSCSFTDTPTDNQDILFIINDPIIVTQSIDCFEKLKRKCLRIREPFGSFLFNENWFRKSHYEDLTPIKEVIPDIQKNLNHTLVQLWQLFRSKIINEKPEKPLKLVQCFGNYELFGYEFSGYVFLTEKENIDENSLKPYLESKGDRKVWFLKADNIEICNGEILYHSDSGNKVPIITSIEKILQAIINEEGFAFIDKDFFHGFTKYIFVNKNKYYSLTISFKNEDYSLYFKNEEDLPF